MKDLIVSKVTKFNYDPGTWGHTVPCCAVCLVRIHSPPVVCGHGSGHDFRLNSSELRPCTRYCVISHSTSCVRCTIATWQSVVSREAWGIPDEPASPNFNTRPCTDAADMLYHVTVRHCLVDCRCWLCWRITQWHPREITAVPRRCPSKRPEPSLRVLRPLRIFLCTFLQWRTHCAPHDLKSSPEKRWNNNATSVANVTTAILHDNDAYLSIADPSPTYRPNHASLITG